MSDIETIKKTLSGHGQEHLLNFYEDLSKEQKEKYLQQLLNIDFEEVTRLYNRVNLTNNPSTQLLDTHMRPLPSTHCESAAKCSKEQLEKYYSSGLEAISNGEVAVLLMAGGQGTRLGVTYPKGMYEVGLISKKTLFQIQAERILKIQQIANVKFIRNGRITWYIMTSGPTHEQTELFLKEHNFFGLKKTDVVLFRQGLLPCFDFKGKFIMNAKDSIALAPDGNGGIYKALKQNGILKDLEDRCIKYVHTHSVDNILIKVADPTFIGYCKHVSADCAAKVVKKSSPNEAVGVVCLVDNKVQVVEYSEITNATATLEDENGLVFNSGNICNHFFTTHFLVKVANKDMKLHIAKKKIPYVDKEGNLITPKETNGIKIEKFVFDVFEYSERFFTYEVCREAEFSPVKNSNDVGKDCPNTAKWDLYKLHKLYLESNNATVIGDEVEISPLLSYAAEGLKKFQGITVTSPCHLTE